MLKPSFCNLEFSFHEKFFFSVFQSCRDLLYIRILHTSRLIDSHKTQDSASIAFAPLHLRGRRHAHEDAQPISSGRFPRRTITTTRRGSVGVVQLSPKGSCVVVDAARIMPSLTRNLSMFLTDAHSRNSQYLIPSPGAIRSTTQPKDTCSSMHRK